MLKGFTLKKIKGNFCARKPKKISIIIKNIIWFEKTLMHEAERSSNFFSNSFTYNQAEQIKKGLICVQILLEIHLNEHGRFHFQGRTTSYTPVLVTPSRHMTSKLRWTDVDATRCHTDVSTTSFQRHAPAWGSYVVFVL